VTNKTRRVLNQNLSIITDDDSEISLSELRSTVRELVLAVTELQGLQLQSRKVDSDNNPVHGQLCESLDGEYLALTQTGAAPNLVKASHTLGRIPQGAIFIQQTAAHRVYIKGDRINGIDAATSTEVIFELNGSVDDVNYCILV